MTRTAPTALPYLVSDIAEATDANPWNLTSPSTPVNGGGGAHGLASPIAGARHVTHDTDIDGGTRTEGEPLSAAAGGAAAGSADALVKIGDTPTSSPIAKRRWNMLRAGVQTATVARVVAAETKTKRRPTCLLDPRGKAMRMWDPVMILLLIFTATITPFEVAYVTQRDDDRTLDIDAMFIVNRVVDALFVLDMVAQFFTARLNADSSLITDRRILARKYLRGWFIVDLVSIVPFDIIGAALLSRIHFLRVLRLLRLAKMTRLLRTNRIVQRWEAYLSITIASLKLVKFVLGVVGLVHWFACLYRLVIDVEANESTNWVKAYFGLSEPGVPAYLTIQSIYPGSIWLVGIMWSTQTICTVGYGDVPAMTAGERIVVVLCMLVGGFVFAYIVGAVCATISSMDTASADFYEELDNLNRYMSENALPPEMRLRLRQYFFFSRQLHRYRHYRVLLHHMSPMLRGQVCMHINQVWVMRVPFFWLSDKNELAAFITDVAMVLEPESFAPREQLIRRGEPANKMYIVQRGMLSRNGQVFVTGSVMGQDMILAPPALGTPASGAVPPIRTGNTALLFAGAGGAASVPTGSVSPRGSSGPRWATQMDGPMSSPMAHSGGGGLPRRASMASFAAPPSPRQLAAAYAPTAEEYRRNYSVRALTYVTTQSLSRDALDVIFARGQYTEMQQAIRRASLRMAVLRAFVRYAKQMAIMRQVLPGFTIASPLHLVLLDRTIGDNYDILKRLAVKREEARRMADDEARRTDARVTRFRAMGPRSSSALPRSGTALQMARARPSLNGPAAGAAAAAATAAMGVGGVANKRVMAANAAYAATLRAAAAGGSGVTTAADARAAAPAPAGIASGGSAVSFLAAATAASGSGNLARSGSAAARGRPISAAARRMIASAQAANSGPGGGAGAAAAGTGMAAGMTTGEASAAQAMAAAAKEPSVVDAHKRLSTFVGDLNIKAEMRESATITGLLDDEIRERLAEVIIIAADQLGISLLDEVTGAAGGDGEADDDDGGAVTSVMGVPSFDSYSPMQRHRGPGRSPLPRGGDRALGLSPVAESVYSRTSGAGAGHRRRGSHGGGTPAAARAAARAARNARSVGGDADGGTGSGHADKGVAFTFAGAASPMASGGGNARRHGGKRAAGGDPAPAVAPAPSADADALPGAVINDAAAAASRTGARRSGSNSDSDGGRGGADRAIVPAALDAQASHTATTTTSDATGTHEIYSDGPGSGIARDGIVVDQPDTDGESGSSSPEARESPPANVRALAGAALPAALNAAVAAASQEQMAETRLLQASQQELARQVATLVSQVTALTAAMQQAASTPSPATRGPVPSIAPPTGAAATQASARGTARGSSVPPRSARGGAAGAANANAASSGGSKALPPTTAQGEATGEGGDLSTGAGKDGAGEAAGAAETANPPLHIRVEVGAAAAPAPDAAQAAPTTAGGGRAATAASSGGPRTGKPRRASHTDVPGSGQHTDAPAVADVVSASRWMVNVALGLAVLAVVQTAMIAVLIAGRNT